MGLLAVALTGNPNTGKSTIFNELTGAKQKIGHINVYRRTKMPVAAHLQAAHVSNIKRFPRV